MKRILNVIIVVLLMLLVNSTNGQINNFLGLSSNQQLIESAVIDGLYVLRQDYVLKDSTNKSYGRGGRSFFGRGYGLGVLTGEDIYFGKSLLTPWDRDSNYSPYRDDTTKRPVLSELNVRALNSRVFDSVKRHSVNASENSSTISKFSSNKKGLTKSYVRGKKDVWIVLLCVNNGTINRNDTTSNFKFITYRKNVDFSNGVNRILVDKRDVGVSCVGGVCVDPKIVSLGKIEVVLTGLIEVIDDEIYVLPISDEMFSNINEPENNELTPISDESQVDNDKKDRSNKRRDNK